MWSANWIEHVLVWMTNLVVDTFIEEHSERPPVSPSVVAMPSIDLGSKVCQRARFTRQNFSGNDVRCHVL